MAIQDVLAMLFGGGGVPQDRPWDEVPRDQYGQPIRLPGMPGGNVPQPPIPGATGPAQPMPQQGGGWKSKIGGILQGGIDAAATPNIAGGGATDIFRALQSAGEKRQDRSVLDYNMGRQQEQDELRRRQVESNIAENEAQTEYRNRLGERERNRYKNLPDGSVMDTYTGAVTAPERSVPDQVKALREAMPSLSELEAVQIVTRQTLPRPAAERPEIPMVPIDPVIGKARGLMPNANGEYIVPANSAAAREVLRQMPGPRPTVLSPGSAIVEGGKITVTNPRVPASRGGGGPKKQTPQATFSGIERAYQRQLADYNRLLATGQIDTAKHAALSKQAEEGYHRAVQSAGGSTDYFDKKGASAAPKKYTEADVRARARAAGVDENAAVEAARSKGLL